MVIDEPHHRIYAGVVMTYRGDSNRRATARSARERTAWVCAL